MEKAVDALLKLLSNAPPFDGSSAARLVVSVALFLLCTLSLIRGVNEASKLRDVAIQKLKTLIHGRLSQPALLTAPSLRALAVAVQKQVKSPSITDSMMAEVIRSVALEIEERSKGRQLQAKLQILNGALRDFDPKGPPLASIAFNDRVTAYALSVLTFAVVFLSAQVFIYFVPNYKFRITWSLLVLVLQLWLALVSIRAWFFWKSSSSSPNILKGNPDRWFDLFLHFSSRPDDNVLHAGWTPLWETAAFSLIPLSVFPSLVGAVTYLIGRLFISDIKLLGSITGACFIATLIGGFLFGTFIFANWHTYKHFTIVRLRKRWLTLNRQRLLAKAFKKPATHIPWQELMAVTRKLFEITGSEEYLKILNEMKGMEPLRGEATHD